MQTSTRAVALTFDDGPNPTYTPQILDLLARYGAHGTFFVVGNLAVSHPELVRRISSSGNALGNHGWNHYYMPSLTKDELVAQVSRGANAIAGITGVRPGIFRPPYGGLNPTVVEVANSYGETVVLWTYSTSDWATPPARVILKRILHHLRPGAIILLHDGGGPRRNTVRAVQMLLPRLRELGYRAVTVPELIRLGHVVSVDGKP